MKKDILFPKPDGVHMAAVYETDSEGTQGWFVYVINTRKDLIHSVMCTSKGYGKVDGKEKITSTLRRVLPDMASESAQKVEYVPEELLGMNNEYWLSFYEDKQIFDKKYIFMAESLIHENEVLVPIIGKKGILIE